MKRRTFVQLLAASPLVSNVKASEIEAEEIPKYRIVSQYNVPSTPGTLGMPGPYPGTVISIKSAGCLDESGKKINAEAVREMMARGMRELTGEKNTIDAWRRFFNPDDLVGIKVNVVGRPWVVSSPEVVFEVIRNLTEVGVKPAQIFLYDRFKQELEEVNYAPRLQPGIQIIGAEQVRGDNSAYDPATYVEADFFGEDDTRSNLMRLVAARLTKIINIPNIKDHGATGATGCLKNIAYGSFSNVARSHHKGISHTLSFVGTLASVEPVRSRTVLQIVDGLRGVWHGGPFARTLKYVFYPKQMMFGTDPVAIDRLLLDIVDDERKRRGAISIWDRNRKYLKEMDTRARDADPNVNILIREPGHVEYAAKLGLGVHEIDKIKLKEIAI